MVGVLTLEISPQIMAAFEHDRAERTAEVMAATVRSAHPGIVNAMPDAELLARTSAGVALCRDHKVETRRDIMILCLVHVMFGVDAIDQPELAWIAPILAEPPEFPDTRAYRIHCRLAES